MRTEADSARLHAFLETTGRGARSPHTLYLVGGTSALLYGWRERTRDVDLLAEPDSDELLRAVLAARDRHDLNVEFASPLQFLPELDGWRDRSPFVASFGALHVRHFDLVSQALAKLARGFTTDLADVDQMLQRGLVTPDALRQGLDQMRPRLFRFPAVNAHDVDRRLRERLRATGS